MISACTLVFEPQGSAGTRNPTMADSGVKTRSLEQTMLSDKAHISLVTDSSPDEDSETDDQAYTPTPEVYSLTCQGYVAHIVRMVSRIAMSFD